MSRSEFITLHAHAVNSKLSALSRTALLLGAIVSWTLPVSAVDESEFLPLPTWNADDASILSQEPQALPLGGPLWPEGFNADSLATPESLTQRTPPAGFLSDPLGTGRRAEGFLLFIPKAPLQSQTPATPTHDLVEVGMDFIHDCEDIEPGTYLVDPHSLLPETQSEDLRRLLAYHTGEARTFAHFLLIDSHEQLPASADLSKIAQGRLVQDHGCLTVYPLAEPWRARIFMTREIASRVPAEYLRGILQACIQDALQASDPVEQIQRFATQLSIRLIWMERAYPDIFAPEEETVAPALSTQPANGSPVILSALAEITQNDPAAAPPAWATLPWKRIGLIACASIEALIVAILLQRAVLRSRRRRQRNSIWLLPEVDIKTRLGAPHCGQGGAWIKYG